MPRAHRHFFASTSLTVIAETLFKPFKCSTASLRSKRSKPFNRSVVRPA